MVKHSGKVENNEKLYKSVKFRKLTKISPLKSICIALLFMTVKARKRLLQAAHACGLKNP